MYGVWFTILQIALHEYDDDRYLLFPSNMTDVDRSFVEFRQQNNGGSVNSLSMGTDKHVLRPMLKMLLMEKFDLSITQNDKTFIKECNLC